MFACRHLSKDLKHYKLSFVLVPPSTPGARNRASLERGAIPKFSQKGMHAPRSSVDDAENSNEELRKAKGVDPQIPIDL